ncbi:phosphonate metabolism transcriptional regulator PhnF [Telmatospirillum sp.]|uniref:phosphonate metabolism transcriptional regulator PhnF n=1 Tax=Telmatospirillum sp. TaxID=2079197 RepID=UPI00284C7950|nr:phosphonate metabolism transcriptional regulator PhnF [Telmatospirillum sp.]MDR3440880.1 phosphonate metabolism transcriptional regulator PhnF [Telmatospirillum sp.]
MTAIGRFDTNHHQMAPGFRAVAWDSIMDIDQEDFGHVAGISLWRQIQQSLVEDIERGRFRPGDRLPTEFELADRFKVNRHTVRRALGEMEKNGLLRVEQGRGTFVHEAVLSYVLGKKTRFTANLNSAGREAGHRLLASWTENADETLAETLAIAEGDPVSVLETMGSADNRPITLALEYVPANRFPGFPQAYAIEGGMTAALRHFGIENYDRKWTRILARLPQGHEADLLQLPKNRPVLVTEALDVDGAGQPVGYGITRFASDRVQLFVES